MRALGLELVTGVEVSLRDTEFPRARDGVTKPRNVHVLAYFLPLDAEHPLQKKLASLRHDRDTRNHELVNVLQEKGFEDLTLAYLTEMTGNVDSIGRPHFARAMIDLHPELVGEQNEDTWNRVFIDWLGTDGAAYVSKTSMPIEEFVDAAKGSGTVFSIAHPLVNYVDEVNPTSIETTMPRVMASLRERGFAGRRGVLRRHERRDSRAHGEAHPGRRDDPHRRIGLSRHLQDRRPTRLRTHRRPAGARRGPRRTESRLVSRPPRATLRARRVGAR